MSDNEQNINQQHNPAEQERGHDNGHNDRKDDTVLGGIGAMASTVHPATLDEAVEHLNAARAVEHVEDHVEPTTEEHVAQARQQVVLTLAGQVAAHASDVESAILEGAHPFAVDAHVSALQTAVDQLTAHHEEVVVSHLVDNPPAAEAHVEDFEPAQTPHDQVATVHAEAASDAARSVIHAIETNAPHEVVAAHVTKLADAASDLHDHVVHEAPAHNEQIFPVAPQKSSMDNWLTVGGLALLALAGAVAWYVSRHA